MDRQMRWVFRIEREDDGSESDVICIERSWMEDAALRSPTTEQILCLFSLAERHELIQDGNTVQVFDVQFTALQRQLLALFGVPEQASRPQ
jgi:hypothetical protein